MELRRSKKFLLLALDIILAIVLILLIARPWQSEPEPEVAPKPVYMNASGVEFSMTVEEPISAPQITEENKTYAGDLALRFVTRVLHSTSLDIFNDAKGVNGRISADLIAKNIDQVVKLNNITDPAYLVLFDFEKAKVYANAKDFTKAEIILNGYIEANLLDLQLPAYYQAMAQYYYMKGDSVKASNYAAKYNDSPAMEGGSE